MSEHLPDERMNMSSMYLCHVDDFSDGDPNSVSLKYSMYNLANTGDNGENKSGYEHR